MYREHKVIVFIPAGRERTLKVLSKHLMRFTGLVDEVWLLRNTEDENDLKYLDLLANNPLFKVKEFPKDCEWHGPSTDRRAIQLNTGKWYREMIDKDTIYVRLDDDIVYIDDNFFKNILDFRIDNPEYFLVFANIINNSVSNYYLQQDGKIDDSFGRLECYCMDLSSWGNPFFAEKIHRLLLEKIEQGKTEDLYMNDHELEVGYRFSISGFCFFGKDFAKFDGLLDEEDEEIWLTGSHPKKNNLKNIICGNALISHLTFSPYQKSYILEDTDIAQQYEQLAQDLLSKGYYNLLTKKV